MTDWEAFDAGTEDDVVGLLGDIGRLAVWLIGAALVMMFLAGLALGVMI